MKAIISIISKENKFPLYLSLFRIFVCFHLLKKIYFIWGSQSILLSNNSFLVQEKNNIDYLGLDSSIILDNSVIFLCIIIITIIFVAFGVSKNIALFILYIEIKLLQEFIHPILNGGDNLLSFVLLYLCFTNCFEYFTLFKSIRKSKLPAIVSNLAVYSICIHLGYVYFISALYKIHSDVWFNGTAIHYIINIERFSSPIGRILDGKLYLLTIICYFTIIFELLFLFLVWNKYLKSLFLICGVILHLGIYFTMMLYDFQIFFISLYGFFLSNNFWKSKMNFISSKINYQFI